jgi:hypothetical protein
MSRLALKYAAPLRLCALLISFLTFMLRTYARRRGRARAGKTAASSPLQVIDREGLPISEMSNRMLKRARRSEEQISKASEEHDKKRAKRSSIAEPAFPLSYDSTDASLYRTPAPSPPPPPQPPPTDRLSPVPVARRILSRRTSSRNLKENQAASTLSRSNSRSRPHLASPFHSRPGSAVSSPTKKKGKRPKSHKARTLSDSKSGNFPPHDKEPVFTMNHSTQNSPHTRTRASIMHNRNPSGPNLQSICPDDWLIPPKALSSSAMRGPLADISPYAYDLSPTESQFGAASFFHGIPHSTPFPKGQNLAGSSNNFVYAHQNALDHDLEMHDLTEEVQPNRRQLHFSADSLFQSSDHFSISVPGPRSADSNVTNNPSLHGVHAAAALTKQSLPQSAIQSQQYNSIGGQVFEDAPDVGYIMSIEPMDWNGDDDPVVRTGPRPKIQRESRGEGKEGSPGRSELQDMFHDLDLGTHGVFSNFLFALTHHPAFHKS